jgi:hypothetical protein
MPFFPSGFHPPRKIHLFFTDAILLPIRAFVPRSVQVDLFCEDQSWNVSPASVPIPQTSEPRKGTVLAPCHFSRYPLCDFTFIISTIQVAALLSSHQLFQISTHFRDKSETRRLNFSYKHKQCHFTFISFHSSWARQIQIVPSLFHTTSFFTRKLGLTRNQLLPHQIRAVSWKTED